MKNIFFAVMSIAAISASPALAQNAGDFSGVKATAITGYDNIDVNTAGVDNPDGLLYGLSLGYDLQSSNIVYGVELEATESTSKISNAAVRIDAGRDLYAGVRLGFVAGNNALVYVKGGYTNARVSSPGNGGDNGDGYRIGGGVDYKLSDKLYVRGEYRYSDYEYDIERHQALLGLGVNF